MAFVEVEALQNFIAHEVVDGVGVALANLDSVHHTDGQARS